MLELSVFWLHSITAAFTINLQLSLPKTFMNHVVQVIEGYFERFKASLVRKWLFTF